MPRNSQCAKRPAIENASLLGPRTLKLELGIEGKLSAWLGEQGLCQSISLIAAAPLLLIAVVKAYGTSM